MRPHINRIRHLYPCRRIPTQNPATGIPTCGPALDETASYVHHIRTQVDPKSQDDASAQKPTPNKWPKRRLTTDEEWALMLFLSKPPIRRNPSSSHHGKCLICVMLPHFGRIGSTRQWVKQSYVGLDIPWILRWRCGPLKLCVTPDMA